MRCDWYQATINDNKNNILRTINDNYEGNFIQLPKGRNGYSSAYAYQDPEKNTLVTVLADGNNGALPNVFATGENAPEWLRICRETWTDSHKVTRIDVCEDLKGQGLFEDLVQKLMPIALRKHMNTSTVGDWITPESPRGRTLYVGSEQSNTRVRLYEKGKQLTNTWLQAGLKPPPEIDRNWVRFEAQIRPERNQRIQASKSELEDFWGYSKWLQEASKECLSLDIERVLLDPKEEKTDPELWAWVTKQYGAFFERESKRLGGYSAVGQHIKKLIDAKNEYDRMTTNGKKRN